MRLRKAAQPMTPHLAEGGVQAIEDAGIPREATDGFGNVPEAFLRYQTHLDRQKTESVTGSWTTPDSLRGTASCPA